MAGTGVLLILSLILAMINIELKSYLVCFICSALFGICDCSYLNYSCLTCNKDFDGRLEAFSLFKFFQGIFVAIILIFNVILSKDSIYIITSICLGVSLINLIISFNLK